MKCRSPAALQRVAGELEKLAIAILTDSRFMLARAEIFGVAPRRSVWSLKRSLILATVD